MSDDCERYPDLKYISIEQLNDTPAPLFDIDDWHNERGIYFATVTPWWVDA